MSGLLFAEIYRLMFSPRFWYPSVDVGRLESPVLLSGETDAGREAGPSGRHSRGVLYPAWSQATIVQVMHLPYSEQDLNEDLLKMSIYALLPPETVSHGQTLCDTHKEWKTFKRNSCFVVITEMWNCSDDACLQSQKLGFFFFERCGVRFEKNDHQSQCWQTDQSSIVTILSLFSIFAASCKKIHFKLLSQTTWNLVKTLRWHWNTTPDTTCWRTKLKEYVMVILVRLFLVFVELSGN